MPLAKNNSITHGPGTWAPPYDRRRWKQFPVRLPEPAALAAMPNGAPFFIPLFDTASLFSDLTPAGVLQPLQSYENDFQMTVDFWWVMTMASFSVGSAASPPFAWQLYTSVLDASGNPGPSTLYQKTPVTSECNFGTAQEPFELREPVHLPVGIELICSVQNLQNANNAVQLVLMGYLVDVNGGPS
jgi:hypothetical protein